MSINDVDAERPGRHRRGGAGTWTPVVGSSSPGSRHAIPEASPVITSLIDPAGEYRRRGAAAGTVWDDSEITAITPLITADVEPVPGFVPEQATASGIDSPTIRRTKITLAPAVEPADDVLVYAARPASDGLSTFDLGSVPASVTPPRSWRRAAWFASLSSSAVVVALLVAGTYLVGPQQPSNQAVDGWTGIRGTQPELYDDLGQGGDPTRPGPGQSRAIGGSSESLQTISDLAGAKPVRPSRTTAAGPDNGTTASTTPTTATTSAPSKPEPTPAARETRSDSVFRFPPDADTMGDRSEIFLNEITENPEKAWEQTGGELYAEGPESIAARYAHIAYFEVKHIYIDQQNRVTINTVNVVFNDGTSEEQQRTLRFEEGDRITQD